MHPNYDREANFMPTWHNEKEEQKHRDVAFKLFVELVNEDVYDPIDYEDFFVHYDLRAPRKRFLGSQCHAAATTLRRENGSSILVHPTT